MAFKKQELKSLLEKSIVVINFTKANKENRSMRCTLAATHMLEENHKSYVKGDSTDDNHIAVWDLDKDGWRSFRVDSVITVELV